MQRDPIARMVCSCCGHVWLTRQSIMDRVRDAIDARYPVLEYIPPIPTGGHPLDRLGHWLATSDEGHDAVGSTVEIALARLVVELEIALADDRR